MKKKANMAGAIILIAAILGSIVVYTSVKHNPPEKQSITQDYTVQLEIMVDSALNLAIRDFIKFGYSLREEGAKEEGAMKGSMVWYLNRPFSPDVNESVRALHKLLFSKLNDAVERLNLDYGKEGYTVAFGGIETNFNAGDELNDLPEIVIVKINELIVTYVREGKIQHIDMSREYTFNYPLWSIYKVMHEWMEEDAGDFTEKMFLALTEENCEARVCCCDQGTNLLDPDELNQMRLQESDMLAVLDESINNLTQKFAGTGITCRYSLEKKRVENKIKYIRDNAAPEGGDDYSFACINNCDQGGEFYNDKNPDYYFSIIEDFQTVPNPGLGPKGNYGQPLDNITLFHTEIDNRTLLYQGNTVYSLHFGNWNDITSTGSPDPSQPLNEIMGMNKLASGLVRVTCSDSSTILETPLSFEAFSPEIYFRFFQYYECPIIEERDTIISECGGDGSSSDGTIIDLCEPQMCVANNYGHASCWTCDVNNICQARHGLSCGDCKICEQGDCIANPALDDAKCHWSGCGWCQNGQCVPSYSTDVCSTSNGCLSHCGIYGGGPRCNTPLNPGADCQITDSCTQEVRFGVCEGFTWKPAECKVEDLGNCCGGSYCAAGEECCVLPGGWKVCGEHCAPPDSG